MNPFYRGYAGAYWALVNDEPENCGVTIHLVNHQVDSGPIIYQKTIDVTVQDNYVTYHLLQLVQEVELIKKTIRDISNNQLQVSQTAAGKNKIWFEPTIWTYLFYRVTKNIK